MRGISFLTAALLGLQLGAAEAAPAAPAAPAAAPPPAGRLGSAAIPEHYRLALTILPETASFSGRVAIDVRLDRPQATLFLHGRDLAVSEIFATLPDGTRIAGSYAQITGAGLARLHFDKTLPKGKAEITLSYTAPFNGALTGLYKVVDDGRAYAFSQFEPISARRAFPSFDQPTFKTPFDITITAREGDKVVTTTPETIAEPAGAGLMRHHFLTTAKLPTYLIAFAVGPLDIVEAPAIAPLGQDRGPIPLRGAATKGKGGRLAFALAHTAEIVQGLESYFGIPYPFPKLDIIAVPDFAAGAMENAGTITYREPLLLLDENSPIRQKRSYFSVHAHELSHQWFGDLVTPKWWDDIWLNESFATWMSGRLTASLYPHDEYDRDVQRDALDVMDQDELAAARAIRQPIAAEDDIFNAFDGITYDKGGGVLSMFESYLGPEAFRDGVRLYLRRFASGNAEARDFFQAMAEGAKQHGIVAAFDSFVAQPGLPKVSVSSQCRDGRSSLALRQSPSEPLGVKAPHRLWKIPFCARPLDGSASCKMLDKPKAAMAGPPGCGPVFPDAGGKGYYRFSLDRAGWQAILQNASGLPPAEQLAALYNLRSAFRSGALDGAAYVSGLSVFAGAAAWDVVLTSTGFFAELADRMIGAEDAARFQQLMRALYGPRLKAIGLRAQKAEAPGNTLLRGGLAYFLLQYGEDPELMTDLAETGRRVVRHPRRARDPELLAPALYALAAKDEDGAVDALIAATEAAQDQDFRRSGLRALALGAPPAEADRLRALLLSDRLHKNERPLLLALLMTRPERQAETWRWLKANFEAYGSQLSDSQRGNLAGLVRWGCDAGFRDDARSFFAPKLAIMVGAPRQLAQALETIDRCVALKAARGAEIAAALRSGAPR
jgi:aminopeptidase N